MTYFKNHIRKISKINFNVNLLVVLTIAIISDLYRITTLPNKLSNGELSLINQSHSIKLLLINSLNLPYKLLLDIIFWLHLQYNILFLKLPSIILSLLTILIVYIVLNNWHGKRTAFLGSLLFVSSSWILHVTRFNGLTTEYLLIIPILFFVKILLNKSSHKKWLLYLVLVLLSGLLFIPGSIWLIILAIINNRKNLFILIHYRLNLKKSLVVVLLSIYPLIILGYNFAINYNIIYQFIGIENSLNIHTLTLINLIKPFKYIFVAGANNYYTWLPGTPIFDGFILTMFLLGMIFYIKNRLANRSKFILISFILCYILSILNYEKNFSLIVTLVYLVAATGITDLLNIWLTQFPRNKLARNFGIIIISLTVFLSCIYNYRQYFVAWNYNITRQTIFAKR